VILRTLACFLDPYPSATLARHREHLDDIRNDLADAGISIPADDDPELTPRRMVRDLITQRAELAAELTTYATLIAKAATERDAAIVRRDHYAAEADALAVAASRRRLAALQRTWAAVHEAGADHDLIEAVRKLGTATSNQIAMDLANECGNVERRMRLVSDYARCGYLTVTKIKGVPHYSLPATGSLFPELAASA
jgi:hypothetical protein